MKNRDKKNEMLRCVRNQEAIYNVLELRAFACKINGNLNLWHHILFILQAAIFFKGLEKDCLFKHLLKWQGGTVRSCIHFRHRTRFNKPPRFVLIIKKNKIIKDFSFNRVGCYQWMWWEIRAHP